jgi:uncharacterized protein
MTPPRLPGCLPLFPLPATVLFPKTYLPLHIFEPRYQEMVRDCLAEPHSERRMIGMVLLKENWEKDYYGNPPIHRVGCAGRIIQVQNLSDGRYNLVLYGLEKFTVKGQLLDRSYRRARIEPTPPGRETVSTLPEPLRTRLVESLRVYARVRGWENQIHTVLAMRLEDEPLVQLLSAEIDLAPAEKQFLLESEGLVQQCRRLIDLLKFMADASRFEKEANRPKDSGN